MALRREKEQVQSSTTDLFGWIDALYTKVTPEGTPPTYMMHRFMASDKDLAQFARVLQVQLREPMLIFKTWQALLPRDARGAPRFGYVVAKKPPQEEELVTRMKSVLSESRGVVEKMIAMVQLAGREKELYQEFGIKPPGEREVKQKPPPKIQGGLLAGRKR